MKFLRTLSFIIALTVLAALILANIFPTNVRHWIKKDSISLDISDKNLNALSASEFEDHVFTVISEKSLYHPYERIIIYAAIIDKNTREVPKNSAIEVEFYHNNEIVRSIDGQTKIKLKYIADKKIWGAYWYPEDPNLLGDISMKARGYLNTPEKNLRTENKFYIDSRHSYKMIPKGLSFLGISDKNLISKRSILSAQAKSVTWTYIPSWMELLSADGIMMLGGLTETYKEDTSLERPWQKAKITETLALADKVQQNGGSFGVWIKTQEVEGRRLEKMGYSSSLKYEDRNYSKELSRVSILDKSRKQHIIEIMEQYANNNSVNYIGLSHIFQSKAHDLELFDNFLNEFHIVLDDDWNLMDTEQKLSRFLPRLKDGNFLKLFNDWKSYAFFDYLNSIHDSINTSKPLFYFAYAEELIEFPDLISIVFNAGMDFLVLNFTGDFTGIQQKIERLKNIADFQKYFDRIIISYEVDIDDFENPAYQMSAIENYINANLRIVLNSSKYYQAQGLMVNGLYRIMPGRRGPYPSNAWMLGFGELIYEYQDGIEKYPLSVSYYLDYTKNKSIYLTMKNISTEKLDNLRIQFYPTKDSQKMGKMSGNISSLSPGEQTNLVIKMDVEFTNSQFLEKKQFLGMRFIWNGQKMNGLNNSFVNLLDIPVNREAPDNKQTVNTNEL